MPNNRKAREIASARTGIDTRRKMIIDCGGAGCHYVITFTLSEKMDSISQNQYNDFSHLLKSPFSAAPNLQTYIQICALIAVLI